jgi:rod shape determining protein RodA
VAIGDTVRMIQPAELCKIAVIITMAKQMSRTGGPMTRVRELLPVLGYLAPPLLIVVLQGELGSVMVYLSIFIGMLFLSGTNWKLLVGLFTTGALSLIPLWYLIGPWRQERLMSFLDPSHATDTARYHVEQSMLAIGSGRTGGKGMFQEGSLTQLSFVPVNHSDFIFSVTAEAVGFWGCLLLIIAYVALILRLFWLSARVQERFGSLLIAGVASMFLFQVFENMAMTMDLMPITGIPLPFMSYGGSAMLTNLVAIGIVQNVLMRPTKSYLLQ